MALVAFRTFLWDDAIANTAESLSKRFTGGKFIVLADETRGSLQISGFDYLSHTSDFSRFGLPDFPAGRSLWYNGDYGLYALRSASPDHDYYVMSEYDVAVNIDVDYLLDNVRRMKIDILAHDVQPATPDWFWYQNAVNNYDMPFKFYMPFIIISGCAIDLLLQARQKDAQRLGSCLEDWPICETFIPSVAMAHGLQIGNLADFASTELLRYRPRLSALDVRVWMEGSIAHPVLSHARFMKAVLEENNPEEYFDKSSELYRTLASTPMEAILGPLLERLLQARAYRGISQLRLLAKQHKLTTDLDLGDNGRDLALARPAFTSSYSEYSFAQNCEVDAAGANSVALAHDYGFHTKDESYPWWMVDLESECVIDAIEIVNRVHFSERFIQFAIDSSRESAVWQARYWKTDNAEVSSECSSPWVILFGDPFVARYVRIKLLGTGPLHLRKVAVRGRRLPC